MAGYTPQRHWERVLSQGRRHYVWVRCTLLGGLGVALGWAGVMSGLNPDVPFLTWLTVSGVAFPPLGWLYGHFAWRACEAAQRAGREAEGALRGGTPRP
jgi:hypothetical protein